MNVPFKAEAFDNRLYDDALNTLHRSKDRWAQCSIEKRIGLLLAIKDSLMSVAAVWAETAARHKQIPEGSSLLGEEWISGPYAVMSACNGLIETLGHFERKGYLPDLPHRKLATGQIGVRVMPHSIWDHLLLSGVKAEVWLEPGLKEESVKKRPSPLYASSRSSRSGKVALVLGAGNIAAITPLDAFEKLFVENQVVLIKMNPVNEYLLPILNSALKPLIDEDVLRIVTGDGEAGGYLCEHSIVEEIHITGAGTTHDAIVWGTGKEAQKNKAKGKPSNTRRVTSELGAVCPTIVVPGPWSKADIKFQAENIATQKMHNSGYNCVACQVLVLPDNWSKTDRLMSELGKQLSQCERGAYYPGASERMDSFAKHTDQAQKFPRTNSHAVEIADYSSGDTAWLSQTEVFGPALATQTIKADDAESYLRAAIAFANDELFGTLGANIVIHPKTIGEIGKARFEEILGDLKYGTIAINTWSGLAFLATVCPWGGFPNASIEEPGSGIGNVHNTFLLEGVERTVIQAPWRPFPRGLLSGQLTLLPRPPWFISNKQQHVVGRLLTQFQYKPSFFKLPRIFAHALLG